MTDDQNKHPDYYRLTIQKAIDGLDWRPGAGAGSDCSDRKTAAPALDSRDLVAVEQDAATEQPPAGSPKHRHTPHSCGLINEGKPKSLEDTKVSPCPGGQGGDLGCLHPSYKDTSIYIGEAVSDTDVTSKPDLQVVAKPLKALDRTLPNGGKNFHTDNQVPDKLRNTPQDRLPGQVTEARQPSLNQRVREYIKAAEGEITCDMIMTHFDKMGVIMTPEQRKNINKILSRLAKKKEIKKVRQGVYRPNTSESNAPRIDFINASTDPIEVRWPLSLGEIVKIYPKNLVVVGGSPNAGKTAFLLNFARLNMNSHSLRYLSSEMGPEELKGRLEDFGRHYEIPLEVWNERVDFRECSCDCLDKRSVEILLDLIEPNGITIVDYLEISRDFHGIAEPFRKMFDRLDQGVVLVGLQKDPQNPWPRGRSFALEKPRIALALDYDKERRMHHLGFTKAKVRARKDVKPEDVDLWFDIQDGARLVLKEKKYQGGPWPP